MAGNVIKTHPESQAARQASVPQSNNVLNMSGMTLFEGINLRYSVFLWAEYTRTLDFLECEKEFEEPLI